MINWFVLGKEGVLQDHAHLPPQRLLGHGPQVHAIYTHAAIGGIVEAGE